MWLNATWYFASIKHVYTCCSEKFYTVLEWHTVKVQNGTISETYCLIVFKNSPKKWKCLKIKS